MKAAVARRRLRELQEKSLQVQRQARQLRAEAKAAEESLVLPKAFWLKRSELGGVWGAGAHRDRLLDAVADGDKEAEARFL